MIVFGIIHIVLTRTALRRIDRYTLSSFFTATLFLSLVNKEAVPTEHCFIGLWHQKKLAQLNVQAFARG